MLKTEFVQRRGRNPRYSLRAFARDLGTDHSSLSQILRSRRSLSPRTIRRFGGRLRLAPQVITEACVRQNAEAVLRLARSTSFRTYSRWIATHTGIPLDAVNAALHWLLYHDKLVMKSANSWTPAKNSHAQSSNSLAPRAGRGAIAATAFMPGFRCMPPTVHVSARFALSIVSQEV